MARLVHSKALMWCLFLFSGPSFATESGLRAQIEQVDRPGALRGHSFQGGGIDTQSCSESAQIELSASDIEGRIREIKERATEKFVDASRYRLPERNTGKSACQIDDRHFPSLDALSAGQ